MHLWDPHELHVVHVTLQRLQLVALKVNTTHRVVHAFEPRLVGPVEAQALPFGVSVTPLPLRAMIFSPRDPSFPPVQLSFV